MTTRLTLDALDAWRAPSPPTGYRIVVLPTRIATLHLERCRKEALGPYRPMTTHQLPPEGDHAFRRATEAIEVLIDLHDARLRGWCWALPGAALGLLDLLRPPLLRAPGAVARRPTRPLPPQAA